MHKGEWGRPLSLSPYWEIQTIEGSDHSPLQVSPSHKPQKTNIIFGALPPPKRGSVLLLTRVVSLSHYKHFWGTTSIFKPFPLNQLWVTPSLRDTRTSSSATSPQHFRFPIEPGQRTGTAFGLRTRCISSVTCCFIVLLLYTFLGVTLPCDK